MITVTTNVTQDNLAAAQGGYNPIPDNRLIVVTCPDYYDASTITAEDIIHDDAIVMVTNYLAYIAPFEADQATDRPERITIRVTVDVEVPYHDYDPLYSDRTVLDTLSGVRLGEIWIKRVVDIENTDKTEETS